MWFPQDGVGRNNSLLKGKNLARKAPPILRDPVPEIPCTVAFWNRLWKIVFLNLDYGIGIKDSRINLQSSSQRANNSTAYGLSFVNEMHYLGDKGPVTVQLISEDEKFWLMQLGFFSH